MTTRPTDTEKRRGTYKGPLPLLKGKEADLICYPSGQCLAKFDDVSTGYGLTQHNFNMDHFDLDRPVNWADGRDLA